MVFDGENGRIADMHNYVVFFFLGGYFFSFLFFLFAGLSFFFLDISAKDVAHE